MKINFKSFRQAIDVEKFFEQHLVLGSATPEDVFLFLDDLGLRHSDLIENSKFIHQVFSYQSDPDIRPSPYEYHISSIAHARPTLFIFENRWMIYFHFNNNKLAEIEVELASVGL
jgi:hypothetical protein